MCLVQQAQVYVNTITDESFATFSYLRCVKHPTNDAILCNFVQYVSTEMFVRVDNNFFFFFIIFVYWMQGSFSSTDFLGSSILFAIQPQVFCGFLNAVN